jgi:hypothetical protein
MKLNVLFIFIKLNVACFGKIWIVSDIYLLYFNLLFQQNTRLYFTNENKRRALFSLACFSYSLIDQLWINSEETCIRKKQWVTVDISQLFCFLIRSIQESDKNNINYQRVVYWYEQKIFLFSHSFFLFKYLLFTWDYSK